MASRDLKALCDAGLFELIGEKRGVVTTSARASWRNREREYVCGGPSKIPTTLSSQRCSISYPVWNAAPEAFALGARREPLDLVCDKQIARPRLPSQGPASVSDGVAAEPPPDLWRCRQ
jgi:hypothetical protein